MLARGAPGPLRIEVLRPPPGSRGKFVNQIGVERHGPGGAGFALLYLDGVTLDPKTYSGPNSATIFANFATKLSLDDTPPWRSRAPGSNAAARPGRSSPDTLEADRQDEHEQRKHAGGENESAHQPTVAAHD